MDCKFSIRGLAALALAALFPLIASAQTQPGISVINGHHGGMGIAPFPIPEGPMDNDRKFTYNLTQEQYVTDPNGITITVTVVEPDPGTAPNPPPPTNTITTTECCYRRIDALITATLTNNFIEAKRFATYTMSVIMLPGLSIRLTAYDSDPPTLVVVDFFTRFQAISLSNSVITLAGTSTQATVHHYGVGVKKFPSPAAATSAMYSNFDYETEETILLLLQAGNTTAATQVSVSNIYEPFPLNLAAINKIPRLYARRGASVEYKISDRVFNVDQQDRSRLQYSGLELPPGIAVSNDGVVSGIYRGTANIHSFIIQAQDSQRAANRAVAVMTILSDTNSYFDTTVSVTSIPQTFHEGVLPQGRSRVTVDGNTTLTVYDPHRIGSFTYVRKGVVLNLRETFGQPTLRIPAEAAVERRLVDNTVENTLLWRPITLRTTTTVQTGNGPRVSVSVTRSSLNFNALVRTQKYVFDVSLKQGATLDYEAQGQPFDNVIITTEVQSSVTFTDYLGVVQTVVRSMLGRYTISLNARADFTLSDGGGALTARLPYAIENLYEGGLGKIKDYNIRGTIIGDRQGLDLIFDETDYVRLDQVGGTAPIEIQAYGDRVVAQEITIRGGTTLSTFITVEVPPNSGRQERVAVVTAIQGGTTLQHISVEPRGVIGREIVTLVAYADPWPWGARTASWVTVRNGQSVTLNIQTGKLNPLANRNAQPAHNRFVFLTTAIDYLRLATHVNRDDAAGGLSGGFLRYLNSPTRDTEARICFGDGSANDHINTEIMGGAARLEPITAGVHKGCQRIIQVKSIGSVAAVSTSVSGRGYRTTTEFINVPVSITSPASSVPYAITMLMPAVAAATLPDFSGRGGPVTVEAGVYFERLYGGIRHEDRTRLTMDTIQSGTVAITEDTGAGTVSQLPTPSRRYLTLVLQDDGMKMFGTVPQPGTIYAGIKTSIYISTGFDRVDVYTNPVTSLFTIIATEARKPTIGIVGIQTLELRSTTTALSRGIDTGFEITVAGAGNRAIASLDIKGAYQRFFTFSPTLRNVAAGTAALQLKQGTTPVFPTVATSLPLTIVATDLSGISSSLTVSLLVTEDELDFNLGIVGQQTVRLRALERPFAADAGTGFTLIANPEKDIPITLVSMIVQTGNQGLFTINATPPINDQTRFELQVRQGATLAFKSPSRITVSLIAYGQGKRATVMATLEATTGIEPNRAPRIDRFEEPNNYAIGDSIAATASANVPLSITVHLVDGDLEESGVLGLEFETHSDKFAAVRQLGANANAASYHLHIKQSVTLSAGTLSIRMIARDVDQLASAPRTYELRVTVDGMNYNQSVEVSIIHNEVTPIIVREIMHLNDLQLSEHVAGLRSKRDRGLSLANQEESAWVAELRDMISGQERGLEEGELSFKEFIAGQKFSLPLSQGANGNSDGVGFGMWGRGDYTKLSQDLKEDGTGMKFEGDIVSGSLGLEGIGRNLAGGLGIGYHKGEFDLTLTTSASDPGKPIDYNMAVYTVNPYIAVFLGDASSAWASFSYGLGDVELTASDAEFNEASHYTNEGELTSMGYSLGASSDVLALLDHQGPHSLDLRLQYSASSSEFTNKGVVEGQAEIEDIPDIEGKSLRVGMKYKAALALGEESQFIPSLAIYGRRNSTEDANVDAVSGFEAITGLAFQGTHLGLAFSGRYLQIEELDAYGGNMKFSYSSVGSGGLGLSFSMTPAYGGLGTGEALYDAAKISDLTVPGRAGLRVGSEASYGMAIPYGLLTPYASYRLSDASTDEYTLGMRYNYGFSKFGLNLQGAQGRDDHDLKVEYHLEFKE